ncbi:MAG: hypothetical protein JXB50_10055 [Spirochaetes bacterium]|nr:hypothetical protein [Spirochaetota bacterium]
MQLKNLKNKVNESIKKINKSIKEQKSTVLFKSFIIILVIIFLFLLSVLIINLSSIIIPEKVINKLWQTKDRVKDNLFKLAEDDYRKGYLENSAINYMRYLNNDIKKTEKVLVYKRLFEISVLQKKYDLALGYLNELESIDKKILEVYIYRIKLLLRLNKLDQVKEEIEKNKNRLKNSIELKELISLYYYKTGNFKESLNILNSIKSNKRDFNIHKIIFICLFKLDRREELLKYIERYEKKLNLILTNKQKSELYLFKALAKLSKNDFFNTVEILKKVKSLNENYESIADKLIIFCNMYDDQPGEVYDIITNKEEYVLTDLSIIKILAEYFIVKNDYERSIFLFEKLEEKRDLSKDEQAVITDLYYLKKDYENNIKSMEKLFYNYKYNTPDIYKNLSISYSMIDNTEKEIFFLKEGLAQYPDDLEFYMRLAKIYIDNDQPDNALNYINKAKIIFQRSKNRYEYYNKKLEILAFLASQAKKGSMTELELLELREKNEKNPESYFKTIEYYINNHQYKDAQREIETVSNIILDDKQKEILSNYKIMYNLGIDNLKGFEKERDFLLSLTDPSIKTQLNLAIIFLFEDDYDKSLEILAKIPDKEISHEFRAKILYLKALCYYYKQDYPLALKIIKNAEEKGLAAKKNSYLKGLVIKYLEK